MRTAPFAIVALALAACAEAGPLAPESSLPIDAAFATTTETNQFHEAFSGETFVPCGNDGAGEFVSLAGPLHTMTHVTEHDTGRLLAVVHVNPRGVRGVGQSSGARYVGTGVFQDRFATNGDDASFSNVNNFRLIGRAGAPSLRVHVVTRVRIEGGVVTSETVLERITCR